MADSEDNILCPSFKCQEGSVLLGIVQKDGRVSFVGQKMLIDKDFVKIANEGRTPEKRFRFSNKCAKTSCEQWTGSRCSVIDKVIDILGAKDQIDLPACPIREECRWFNQCGSKACTVCPEVITDLT
jgi:hypothetical protein